MLLRLTTKKNELMVVPGALFCVTTQKQERSGKDPC
jgi:hypothetical protein